MAETPRSTAPFDLDKLKELVEMMEKHGVTEVNLRRADERWVLRRGPAEVINMMAPGGYAPPNYPAPAMPAPSHQAAAPVAATGVIAATAPIADSGLTIKSPTVGTFYLAPTPSDPPFVTVGSVVKPDSVVCVIEAMKVFNQIPAEIGGTIVEVLVANGDAVEYGQPLFRVKP